MLFALAMLIPLGAQAGGKVPYSAAAAEEAKAKGCSVFLEFGASW